MGPTEPPSPVPARGVKPRLRRNPPSSTEDMPASPTLMADTPWAPTLMEPTEPSPMPDTPWDTTPTPDMLPTLTEFMSSPEKPHGVAHTAFGAVHSSLVGHCVNNAGEKVAC